MEGIKIIEYKWMTCNHKFIKKGCKSCDYMVDPERIEKNRRELIEKPLD